MASVVRTDLLSTCRVPRRWPFCDFAVSVRPLTTPNQDDASMNIQWQCWNRTNSGELPNTAHVAVANHCCHSAVFPAVTVLLTRRRSSVTLRCRIRTRRSESHGSLGRFLRLLLEGFFACLYCLWIVQGSNLRSTCRLMSLIWDQLHKLLRSRPRAIGFAPPRTRRRSMCELFQPVSLRALLPSSLRCPRIPAVHLGATQPLASIPIRRPSRLQSGLPWTEQSQP